MTPNDHHHQAMALADDADVARQSGESERARLIYAEAFRHEKEAALALADDLRVEPSRSVLFRSAATLALEFGELREAERMVAMALTGSPPPEIAEELRDLLERINFERHLQLRGVKLDANEFQMSIWGPAVGLGFAQSREVRERIERLESLAYRTLERKLDHPFREAGRPPKDVTEIFDIYVSVPRAASFAVTIRLAGNQGQLPGLDLGIDVVAEIVEGIRLLDQHRTSELRAQIKNEEYFSNFVSLARHLAPDGERVTDVGLTVQDRGEARTVRFSRRRSDLTSAIETASRLKSSGRETVEVRGNLRFADALRKKHGMIELVDDKNAIHKVRVPLAMMADIVRPLFEFDVVVKGTRTGGGPIFLQDIERA